MLPNVEDARTVGFGIPRSLDSDILRCEDSKTLKFNNVQVQENEDQKTNWPRWSWKSLSGSSKR